MFSLRAVTVPALMSTFALGAYAVSLGEWEQLPEPQLADLFDRSDYAFDITDNLAFCEKMTKNVNIDGSEDYTAIINAELAALGNAGGGQLKMGSGTFEHTGQLIIPSYVCLVGSGIDNTILKLKDNSPEWGKSGAIRSMHSERVTVMDLTQDGNKENQRDSDTYGRYGYFHELTNFVYLRNVKIMNNFGYGFDPHGSKTFWSYYLVIENCEATENGIDGFTLDQTMGISLLNSTSWANTRHGTNLVTGLRTGLVKGNIAYDNGLYIMNGCGYTAQNNMDIYITKNILFHGNIATNNYKAGFCLNDVSGVVIEHSVISGTPSPSTYCFQVTDTTGVNVIADNTCQIPSNRVIKNINATVTLTGTSGTLPPTTTGGGGATTPTLVFSNLPDPECVEGISRKTACCPKDCGQCGGSGCGLKGKDMVCCFSGVSVLERYCDTTGAPCLLSPAVVSSSPAPGNETGGSTTPTLSFSDFPDPKCDNGFIDDDSCCPQECGQCGGIGCGLKGKDMVCCTSGVMTLNRSCDTTGAPCLISSTDVSVSPEPTENENGSESAPTLPFAESPDPHCEKGINSINNSSCCPVECEQCGGSGCGLRGKDMVCCISGVMALNRSCDSTGAPCLRSADWIPSEASPSPSPPFYLGSGSGSKRGTHPCHSQGAHHGRHCGHARRARHLHRSHRSRD